jgi:hypothetical protein
VGITCNISDGKEKCTQSFVQFSFLCFDSSTRCGASCGGAGMSL